MFARHFIDSLDFARHGRELQGTVALAQMPRLQDLLTSLDGELSYTMRGSQDISGKPQLDLALDGQCQLRCQRCLDNFTHTLHLDTRLLLVRGAEVDMESSMEDDPDRILASDHLDVLELLEDEILLSLPIAPKHLPGECGHETDRLVQSAQSPFAALSALKQQ